MIKKIAKKTAKVLGILLIVLVLAFGILYLIYNEPVPKGELGENATALAEKMQEAVNKAAWDTTYMIQFSFAKHDYIWDRKQGLVQVKWGKYRVMLNPSNIQGKAYYEEKEQSPETSSELLQTAYKYFTNDAFWLNAFVQIYNGNPEHRTVQLPDGQEGLMVTYPSGGVTPGDSYLWILDENGLPKSWKMWVSILPIGGIEVGWEDWITLPTGAKLPLTRNFGLMKLKMENVKVLDQFILCTSC